MQHTNLESQSKAAAHWLKKQSSAYSSRCSTRHLIPACQQFGQHDNIEVDIVRSNQLQKAPAHTAQGKMQVHACQPKNACKTAIAAGTMHCYIATNSKAQNIIKTRRGYKNILTQPQHSITQASSSKCKRESKPQMCFPISATTGEACLGQSMRQRMSSIKYGTLLSRLQLLGLCQSTSVV